MLAEAPAQPSPESLDMTSETVSAPDMSAQEAVDVSRDARNIDQSVSTDGSVSPSEILEFINPDNAEVSDGALLFRMPEETATLIDRKIPASARQNGAILSVIYEVDDLAPQMLGYILGSGRTWWFVTFEEAMDDNIEYVAGFARGYVMEKLWQSSTF